MSLKWKFLSFILSQQTQTVCHVTSSLLPNTYPHLHTLYCFNLPWQGVAKKATFIHSSWDFLTLPVEAIHSFQISVVLYLYLFSSRKMPKEYRYEDVKRCKLDTFQHKGVTKGANKKRPTWGPRPSLRLSFTFSRSPFATQHQRTQLAFLFSWNSVWSSWQSVSGTRAFRCSGGQSVSVSLTAVPFTPLLLIAARGTSNCRHFGQLHARIFLRHWMKLYLICVPSVLQNLQMREGFVNYVHHVTLCTIISVVSVGRLNSTRHTLMH
jgi:hypothetical protein